MSTARPFDQQDYKEYRAAKRRAERAEQHDVDEEEPLPPPKTGSEKLELARDTELGILKGQYTSRLKKAYREWFLAGKPAHLKPDENAPEYCTEHHIDPMPRTWIDARSRGDRKLLREYCIARKAAADLDQYKTPFGRECDQINQEYSDKIHAYKQTPYYRLDLLHEILNKAAEQVELIHAKLYEPWRLKLEDKWADEGQRTAQTVMLQHYLDQLITNEYGGAVTLLQKRHWRELSWIPANAVYEYALDTEQELIEQYAKHLQRHLRQQPGWTPAVKTPKPAGLQAYLDASMREEQEKLERWQQLSRHQAPWIKEARQEASRREESISDEQDWLRTPSTEHLLSIEDGLAWKISNTRLQQINLKFADPESLTYPEYCDLVEEQWTLQHKTKFADLTKHWMEQTSPRQRKNHGPYSLDATLTQSMLDELEAERTPANPREFRTWQRQNAKKTALAVSRSKAEPGRSKKAKPRISKG